MATGIDTRHARSCRSRQHGRCDCEPTYQANVWDGREGKRHRRTFPNETAARAWRKDAQIAIRRGRGVDAPQRDTLRATVDEWLEGARAGFVRNRSGDPYKPSAIRGYEQALTLRALPELGGEPIEDIRRADLQDLVDELVATDLSASTIQMTIVPLKAIFRRELSRGRLTVNPTVGVELPAVRSQLKAIVSPAQATTLIAALEPRDRALWATALYAGLRRGELMALRWEDVDLKAGVIHVRGSWDPAAGEDVGPKSREGKRRVPIASVLRTHLRAHRLASGRAEGYVFGNGSTPFGATKVRQRADKAWKAARLERVTLHACRHTFASMMIAAGVNAKALSTYMGHANIAITLNLYGHLMPGNEDEAAGMLDAYLVRAGGGNG
jgi:integrase